MVESPEQNRETLGSGWRRAECGTESERESEPAAPDAHVGGRGYASGPRELPACFRR